MGPQRGGCALKKALCIVAAAVMLFISSCSYECSYEGKSVLTENDRKRFEAVKTFTDNVLKHGRGDRYEKKSPLFANGINTATGEHIRWTNYDGKSYVLCNMASQQNLFRTLAAMTNLTGDKNYKKAAMDAINFMFKNHVSKNGLIYWGGHAFIDLATQATAAPSDEAKSHELKNAYPYYDLMYEVDREAASRFVRAFWGAHVVNWDRLEFNRHGRFTVNIKNEWARQPADHPVFYETRSLTFINAASDLIYAAAVEYTKTGNRDALKWARELAFQYVRARDPETGLGSYQYTIYADASKDRTRYSGDRARQQFYPELGEKALEPNILLWGGEIYGDGALMQLYIAKKLGDDGRDFLEWTADGLLAFARHAYVPEENRFKPMLTDGTDLTGFTIKRDGYFGSKGRTFERYGDDGRFLLSYIRAYEMTGNAELWNTARSLAHGFDIGDVGTKPGESIRPNLETNCSNARVLFAIVDLYNMTKNEGYLNLARRIGDNILAQHCHNGYFKYGPEYANAGFDMIEPYALLALHSVITGRSDAVPPFFEGGGYTEGGLILPNGTKLHNAHEDDILRIKK